MAGRSGVMAVWNDLEAGHEAEFEAWMSWIAAAGRAGSVTAAPAASLAETFDDCLRDPACVRLQLWECDAAVARLANPEAGLRAARDRVADWIVCIEAATCESAAAYRNAVAQRLRSNVQPFDLICAPVYRLLWRMQADEAPLPSES